MKQTVKQIDLSLEEFDAIIEALNDFYLEEKDKITLIDGKTNESEILDLSKLEDLKRLYINYCLDNEGDLWQSINNFLGYILNNTILIDLLTEQVYNHAINLINE